MVKVTLAAWPPGEHNSLLGPQEPLGRMLVEGFVVPNVTRACFLMIIPAFLGLASNGTTPHDFSSWLCLVWLSLTSKVMKFYFNLMKLS